MQSSTTKGLIRTDHANGSGQDSSSSANFDTVLIWSRNDHAEATFRESTGLRACLMSTEDSMRCEFTCQELDVRSTEALGSTGCLPRATGDPAGISIATGKGRGRGQAV